MINKKGFTLIELLAVIVILGVIMLIAVPNIISTLDKNKKDSFIEDAKQMIASAEYKIRVDKSIEYPGDNDVVIIKLSSLDSNHLDESPYGTFYSRDKSFVAITKEKVNSTEYERVYYAHLVSCANRECSDDTDPDFMEYNYGINLKSSAILNGDKSRFDVIESGTDVILDLIDNESGILSKLGKAGNVIIY